MAKAKEDHIGFRVYPVCERHFGNTEEVWVRLAHGLPAPGGAKDKIQRGMRVL
jgi:hypothetical protein